MSNKIQAVNRFPIVISIRMTPDLHDHIHQTAQAAGMTMSRYARERLAGHRITAKADQQARSELRQLGGLLKKLWGEGLDTGPTLKKIDQALERI